jgi:hypothetical protein
MKKPVRLLVFGVVMFCGALALWFFQTPLPLSPEAEGNGVTIVLVTPTIKK